MSSQDVDVDISVVSSPEPSPRPDDHDSSRNEYQYSSQMQHQQQPLQQLQRHSAFNHSSDSRLSPPKTPPEQHCKTSTGPAYTSFSITSILSRSEPKKSPITPMPTLPLSNDVNGSAHDAAMISRWVHSYDAHSFQFACGRKIIIFNFRIIAICDRIPSLDEIIFYEKKNEDLICHPKKKILCVGLRIGYM